MDRNIIFLSLSGFFFLLFFGYPLVQGQSCSSYRADLKTALKNKVISGHVIKTISVSSFGECFRECAQSCYCRSLNIEEGGNGVCELNDVDIHEANVAVQRKTGFMHISFAPETQVWYRNSNYSMVLML